MWKCFKQYDNQLNCFARNLYEQGFKLKNFLAN